MESALYRLPAHRFAVAGETPGLGARECPLRRPGEAHGTDRLFGAAATGARDAGDGERDVGAAMRERAERHFARGLFAHRAVARERLRAYAEHLLLRGVRIGNEAALEPAGGAGDRGKRLRRPAAGARFGGGEHRALLEQGSGNPFGERVHASSRLTSASTTSVYAAASRSSNMTPKPPWKRRSKARIGGGLAMSKRRKSAKPAACHPSSRGRSASTSQNATISSQTIARWSATPRWRPVTEHAQMPMAKRGAAANAK